MTPDLLVLCATRHEVPPDIFANTKECRPFSGSQINIFRGRSCETSYDLLITGPGVFNSAHALTAYLEHHQSAAQSKNGRSLPLILQIGIAGVFKESGLKVGDLAVAEKEHYIHTGIEADPYENAPLPFELIQNRPMSRKGIYLFESDRVEAVYKKLNRVEPGQGVEVKKGAFITVSTLTASFETARQMYSAAPAVMENMEGAATAHIAALYQVPMIEIRAGSNQVGDRDKSNWDIDLAVRQLDRAWTGLIDDGILTDLSSKAVGAS
jgi:futalosine hydrolase